MTGATRQISFLLTKLLKDNVTSVSNRVYPPGERVDATKFPRINVYTLSPQQQFAALGATAPTWRIFTTNFEIQAIKPQDCEIVAGEIEQTIMNNPNYRQANVTFSDWQRGAQTAEASNGYFNLLRCAGGSPTSVSPAMNSFRKTVTVTGKWLQTA